MSKKPEDKESKANPWKPSDSGDFTIVHGVHKAENVKLAEATVNKQVLRVHLTKLEGGSVIDKIDLKKRGTPKSSGTVGSQKVITGILKNKKSPIKMHKSEVTFDINTKGMSGVSGVKRVKSDSDLKHWDSSHRSINGSRESAFVVNSSRSPVTGRGRSVLKMRNVKSVTGKPPDPHFVLEFAPSEPSKDRILNYKFSKLSVDVRSLRLPAPHWKIKIYMKNKVISAIAFTNKLEKERILKFSSASDMYDIVIDNKKACLLGSPVTIDSGHDVELLLDIIHSINPTDPMITYIDQAP